MKTRLTFPKLVSFIFLWSLGSTLTADAQSWRLADAPYPPYPVRVHDIDISLSNPDSIYALINIDNTRLLLSTNQGEIWDTISRTPQTDVGGGYIKVDAFDSRIIYASLSKLSPTQFNNAVTEMTTDGGRTWTRISFVFNTPYQGPFAEVNPISRASIYLGAGNGIIKRSTNKGQSWEDLVFASVDGPYVFGISRLDTNIFYGITTYGYVFRTSNAGDSWTLMGRTGWIPTSMVIDPRNDSVLYVSAAYALGGVWKSTDAGTTWTRMINGISDTGTYGFTLAMNPRNPDELLVATEPPILLYRTTDAGLNWSRFDLGLPEVGSGKAIAFDSLNNRIYFGSTRGIYIYDFVTSVKNVTKKTPVYPQLYQNYPNPFNPTSTIRFDVHEAGRVKISVYDILGREVRILLDEHKEIGTYRVNFDATGLASGTYFYRLQSSITATTRSMVYLR